MVKRALITGVTGQDGAYLAELLLSRGYEVFGTVRHTSAPNPERLDELGITEGVQILPIDMLDLKFIIKLVERVRPDELYNLAARSSVAASFKEPLEFGDATGLGAVRVLEAIRTVNPRIRFYQASSSEMFGKTQAFPQNEDTPLNPRSPYAAAKAYAHFMTVNYREAYDIYACAGILFNHESPLRGSEYVTRKITGAVARIKHGLEKELFLGNLDAKRDWGYAPEYVEAMWLMLQQDRPEDYVIATGQTHSVRDFVAEAFSCAGLDWREHVRTDPAFYRPTEIHTVVGDPGKAEAKLPWRARTGFADLVRVMVEADLRRVRAGLQEG